MINTTEGWKNRFKKLLREKWISGADYCNGKYDNAMITFFTQELAIAREEAEQKGRDEAAELLKSKATSMDIFGEKDEASKYLVMGIKMSRDWILERPTAPKPINRTN